MKDREIIKLLESRSGKQKAISLIIDRYQEQTYWHIRSIVIGHDDSKDILQEVFIRVWKNLGSFRADSKLSSWIYRIATNESLRFLNRKVKIDQRKEYLGDMLRHDEASGGAELSGKEVELKLKSALIELSDSERIVFNLRYYQELGYREIAEILEKRENTLKVTYHNAKRRIEEIIKREI